MTRAIDVGSVCVKTTGREAGRKAVVLEVIDNAHVLVQGVGVRKRKCNISHLFPTGRKVKAKSNNTEKELREMLSK